MESIHACVMLVNRVPIARPASHGPKSWGHRSYDSREDGAGEESIGASRSEDILHYAVKQTGRDVRASASQRWDDSNTKKKMQWRRLLHKTVFGLELRQGRSSRAKVGIISQCARLVLAWASSIGLRILLLLLSSKQRRKILFSGELRELSVGPALHWPATVRCGWVRKFCIRIVDTTDFIDPRLVPTVCMYVCMYVCTSSGHCSGQARATPSVPPRPVSTAKADHKPFVDSCP
ncbi:hypothetical protein B0H63DRAFT_211078 [Podospora didyma]|uniref:Uncharacterized protein n=1 Tax=Podospora didyma TaxID=330526 RepID=A0AAE0TW71_9PEZI|nr:hypothetical protein B0H63DRAFT_211078 [Podospora didyma]